LSTGTPYRAASFSAAWQEGHVFWEMAAEDVKYDINIDYSSMRISESSIDDGYAAMNSILESGKRPSAVFAVTDVLAIGAVKAIQHAGLKIPGDIAVIGFDDIEYSSIIEPKLSTVWVDKETMGKLAVNTLLRLISGEKPESRILYAGTKLIIRETT
jgi:DNA-binding LacI/PurR family transcriptional regulator